MKSFFQTALLVMLVVGVTACGNNKKKGVSFNDRGARAQTVSPQAQTVMPTKVLFADNRYSLQVWMDAVKRLASSSIEESYVQGSVSQNGSGNTGVYIGGRLCLQGNLSQSITNRALIVVHIQDEYGIPIPIYLNASSGNYNASTGTLDVTFQDEYGAIRINAQKYGSNIQGYVSFDTRVRYDGSSDTRGSWGLGNFYMTEAELFSCY